MLAIHQGELDRTDPTAGKTKHGFPLRLALSCLVDADHSDSATFDTGLLPAAPPAPRWPERLAALDAYVQELQAEASARGEDRAAFYAACRHRAPDTAMIACEGPVGIGKTTAVTAYLLRRAIATGARRLFVVAPYTAILSQTAKTLRDALVLADERHAPDTIVAEHHHRAEFDDIASRDLAVNWGAPIVLTTAVQFFETLAANSPAALRKLHALPGSVVFLDEAHAAIPAHLWA
jgi:CRISPR-associated endonuclease/helicase Cas3